MSEEYPDPTFALFHHLHDTILLLGGTPELAKLIESCKDGVTDAKVEEVRRVSCSLIGPFKLRMAALHRIQIQVTGESNEGKP